MNKIFAAFLVVLAAQLAFAAPACDYDAQPYLDQTFFVSCVDFPPSSNCRVLSGADSTILGIYPENSSFDADSRFLVFQDGSLAFGFPLPVGKFVEKTNYFFSVTCTNGTLNESFTGSFAPSTPQSPLWFNTWLVFLKENALWGLAILAGFALIALAGLIAIRL